MLLDNLVKGAIKRDKPSEQRATRCGEEPREEMSIYQEKSASQIRGVVEHGHARRSGRKL